jgi:hypothetical protein
MNYLFRRKCITLFKIKLKIKVKFRSFYEKYCSFASLDEVLS